MCVTMKCTAYYQQSRPRPATRYCFCLRSTILSSSTNQCVGIIYAYGKTIATTDARVRHAKDVLMRDSAFLCDDTELVVHAECPIEVSEDVYIQYFKSSKPTSRHVLSGYDSDMSEDEP
jgi:hypothetical protein